MLGSRRVALLACHASGFAAALVAAVALGAGACSSQENAPDGKDADERTRRNTTGAPELAQAPETASPAPAAPEDTPAGGNAPAPAGHDFIDEARLLYRVVACAGDDPIPAHLDAAVIDAHCKRLEPRKQQYRTRYARGAKEFIARLRPTSLPSSVVYPFGGGDLISALVAFPDALEITTISLEHAGDPRRIRELDREALAGSLAELSVEIGGMLSVSNNTSKNMSEAHQNLLPAQLASFLIGLAVNDMEPVSVRYLELRDDGTIRYLDRGDIQAVDEERARRLKHDWAAPNFSPAFSHVEIAFRRRGAADGEPVRIHRHFAANLADAHLAKNPAIIEHLRAKGKVAAMTKAASYLLWRGDFATIRDYLLGHMVWMISDSTGIPPLYATKAGMEQMTLGLFDASFLGAPERHNEDFRALWQAQPYRRLPFRFGYVDASKHAHLLVTAPAGTIDWAAAGPVRKARLSPAGPAVKKKAAAEDEQTADPAAKQAAPSAQP